MIKPFYIIFIILIATSCSLNPVDKYHGVAFLEKKQEKLFINKSNKNDIVTLLGRPSTTSKFESDVWIYIERKETQSKITNFGKMKIFKNNVLILDLDKKGILKKKEFYNINDMENLKIVKSTTESGFTRNSFVYDFLSSMRQKVNDPLGQRAKKRKEISQR